MSPATSESGRIVRAYAETPFGQVHYRHCGEGEPVVFLHQSAAWSATWEWLLPRVSEKFRCFAPDTPGFGMSDPPPMDKPLANDYARIIVAFMDAVGLGKVNVVGHHTGASIAVEIAAAFPDRVDKLIVNGVPVYNEDGVTQEDILNKSPRLRRWFAKLPLQEDGSHLVEAWNTINDMATAGQAFDRPYDDQAKELVHHEVLAKLMSRDAGKEAYHMVFSMDILQRLEDVAAPTLIWTGAKDPLFPNHHRAVERVKRVKAIEGSGGTYFTAHLDAEFAAKTIVDFLTDPGV